MLFCKKKKLNAVKNTAQGGNGMDVKGLAEWFAGILWGTPLLVGLVGTGIFFTVKSGFWQFSPFGYGYQNGRDNPGPSLQNEK